MVMPATTYWTADMVRALPDDGQRYETVHGELLVTPSPALPHQAVLLELVLQLGRYLEGEPGWRVLTSPADISWSEDILVQPDIFVASAAETRTHQWPSVKTLALAVEILSPSSKRQDRFTKRRLYQTQGVADYWVVDLESRAIEAWTPGATLPVIERDELHWHPTGAAGPLILDVARLFSRALDD